jgi:hypothetical protein
MKTLKQILTEMRSKAVESAESGYNNVWIRRSKQDPEDSLSYINENASITQASEDKTTEWIYNLWVKTTEEGLEEMDTFVETELIPKGMSLYIHKDTKKPMEVLSKDQGSVRFMIARSNLTS